MTDNLDFDILIAQDSVKPSSSRKKDLEERLAYNSTAMTLLKPYVDVWILDLQKTLETVDEKELRFLQGQISVLRKLSGLEANYKLPKDR